MKVTAEDLVYLAHAINACKAIQDMPNVTAEQKQLSLDGMAEYGFAFNAAVALQHNKNADNVAQWLGCDSVNEMYDRITPTMRSVKRIRKQGLTKYDSDMVYFELPE